jgi:hypothetical protein
MWDLRPVGGAIASALTFQLAASTGGSATGNAGDAPPPAFGSILGAVTVTVGPAVAPGDEPAAVLPGGIGMALDRQPERAKMSSDAMTKQDRNTNKVLL